MEGKIEDSTRQRGFYSEFLAPEASKEVEKNLKKGPAESSIIHISKKQVVPRAYNPMAGQGISRMRNGAMDKALQSRGSVNSLTAGFESSQKPKGAISYNPSLNTNQKSKFLQFTQDAVKEPLGTYGVYSKEEQGVAMAEPKVMEPYVPIIGRVPRKVEIDRKKKLFKNVDLEQLLEDHGVFKNDEPQYLNWLPLELFDDETFDDYEAQEWIQKAKSESGEQLSLRALGLVDQDGSQRWRKVLINKYDESERVFNGVYSDETHSKCSFSRINLWFEIEDPLKFVERVSAAHYKRKVTDSKVRYRFYIDNMPRQDVNAMDPEQKTRLINNAKNTRMLKLSNNKNLSVMEDLKAEASQEYERTMNKIIFDEYIVEANPDLIPVKLEIPEEEIEVVNEFGLIDIPRREEEIVSEQNWFTYPSSGDFSEIFTEFCFSSLYIKNEVILALQGIKEKCKEILEERNLFNIDYAGGDRIDAFRNTQGGNISSLGNYLKETWIFDMTQIIKDKFSSVGKGWFNMKETNRLTYEFGKLKRFLTVIRLNMQDTLFTLIHRGLFDFKDYLLSFIPERVEIISESKVINHYGESSVRFRKNKGNPLMKLDMVRVSSSIEFGYSVKPQKIVEEILKLISKSLEEMESIPDLEPKILKSLHKAKQNESYVVTPILPTSEPVDPDPSEKPKRYPDENKWVWDIYNEFKDIMTRAVNPLEKFTQVFDQYKFLLEKDPDEYIRKLEGNEDFKDSSALKNEVIKFTEAERNLKESIPEEIQVSCFSVDCKELIRILSGKYQDLIKRLIELMARRARDSTTEVNQNLNKIQKGIRTNPENIEELTEIKNFIEHQLPVELNRIRLQTTKAIEIYDILEDYSYRVSREDFQRRWEAYRGPLEVENLVGTRTKDFQRLNNVFKQEMNEDQEEFLTKIKQKEDAISRLFMNNKIEKHEEFAKQMTFFKEQLEEMSEEARLYNSREQLFQLEMSDYSTIEDVKRDLKPYFDLWINIDIWKQNNQKWLKDPWQKVDSDSADKFVDEGLKKIVSCIKYLKGLEATNPQITQLVELSDVVKSEIDEFKPKVPLLVSLKRDGMTDRHWNMISEATGKSINPKKFAATAEKGKKAQKFNLEYLVSEGLLNFLPDCTEIGEKAYREYNIQQMLTKMEDVWKEVEFKLLPHGQTFIIASFEEVEAILDEHMGNTQNLLINPYKEFYQDQIDKWFQKMLLVSNILDEWSKFQRQWKYLSPIFESPDISKDLPNESNLFKRVDANWKHALGQTKIQKNVLKICEGEGYKEKFREANITLDKIQKELNAYLEKKRVIFGRFYFLSDDDLLSILSQTKDVHRIQDHLNKVFENIQRLDFDSSNKITGMNSSEKENVKFVQTLDPNHVQVERWMSDVEEMMRKSVRYQLEESVRLYDKNNRNSWVLSQKGQCVINGSQIIWTAEVEEAILEKKGGNKTFFDDYLKGLQIQLSNLITIDRTGLTQNQFVTVEALIVIDVHALDIVEEKLKDCDRLNAFEWISQLRYYWRLPEGRKNKECFVECVQTIYPYGYEYLGNSGRLVITPLTDQCYITLMGALKLNLGGAPAGPAGTGKTESTKDLAKALAKQCVVFNCQESMDNQFVGKFFKGLASSGAWCCFDEFNRINLEVLSVIAQQLQELFTAKAKEWDSMLFEGSKIKIKHTFSVFITMNPGYAGRTELPDNLKALFRPVAMMVPDYSMIAEIRLFSFGFSKEMGRELAKKIVATFRLSSEQLSSQNHYDYGMRAVTSVINAAGILKRNNEGKLTEDQLILKALSDVNLPKFLKDDLPLFKYIILDLFPDTVTPPVNYGELTRGIQYACEHLKLQNVDVFRDKVYQLYDTIQVRHGLMLVGPTGGGKTSNIKVLETAMSRLAKENPKGKFTKVNIRVINPKSITMAQLYGESKEMTWQKGIVEVIMGEATQNQYDPEKGTEKFWILFDGPVDALWIESMNTVLDDNKKLCLSSGKVLKMSDFTTMMFEVEDLAVASPATVSRCGMVYMEPVSLGYQPLIDSFIQDITQTLQKPKDGYIDRIRTFINIFFESGLEVIRKKCKETLQTMNSNIVQSFFKMLNITLCTYEEKDGIKIKPAELAKLTAGLDNLLLFCYIWSFCCTVDEIGRERINEFVRENLPKIASITIPPEGEIYDYRYDLNENKWENWLEMTKNFTINQKFGFSDIIVPTIDFQRIQYVQNLLLSHACHVLCPGPTGTGKSVGAVKLLSESLGKPDKFTGISMVLSAQTSSNQVQDTIFQQTEKRRKGIYGPPNGKKLIALVDDLNMPKKEEYGAQPPIELLRQYLDYGAWYVISEDKEYLQIIDVILLACMGPPGGGRTHITNRMVRHFNIITYTEIHNDVIRQIYDKILFNFLGKFSEDITKSIPKMITSVIGIYDRVKRDLKPIPSKSHYTFNLRDISKVFQGICNASANTTKEVKNLVRLWYHEEMRVFHDRLTTTADREYFIEQLESIFPDFGLINQEIYDSDERTRIIFCDFVKSSGAGNKYCQVESMSELVSELEKIQTAHDDIAKSNNKLDLVLFEDACEHVCRISRILKQPQGHALLLGVGGSGRQSLTKLSAFIRDMEVKKIEVGKGYNLNKWREDIKRIIMDAIDKNVPQCFLFVDTQIVDQMMVEDINSLLNSGFVVGLPFSVEEQDKLDEIASKICLDNRLTPTKVNVYQAKVERVKRNTHVCFAMSPLGEAFFTRLRMFPSFINCCTIDWFTEWPEEALVRVGHKEIDEDATELFIEGKTDALVEMFKYMHKSVEKATISYLQEQRRHNYVTPTSYLELIKLFKKIIKDKNNKNTLGTKRLENGIDQLLLAETEVKRLNEKLTEEEPMMIEAEKNVQEFIESLKIEESQAIETEKMVSLEKANAMKQEKEALQLKASIEAEVAQTAMELEKTQDKLKGMDPKDIGELRTYKTVSSSLKTLGIGIIYLLSPLNSIKFNRNATKDVIDEYFWNKTKTEVFKEPVKFIEQIKNLDKDNLDPARIFNIKKMIYEDPERKAIWNPAAVEQSSRAGVIVYYIIDAMVTYYEKFTGTEPQRRELARIVQDVAEKKELVRVKELELDEVKRKIGELNEQLRSKTKECADLKAKIEDSRLKLERANKLTSLLGNEKTRWRTDIQKFKDERQLIAGNSVLSAGMVAYAGPFTSDFRQDIEKDWQNYLTVLKLDHLVGVTMSKYLENPVDVQYWNIKGLPKDETSKENGIIIYQSNRWPLMIDPQTQAVKFIKKMGKDHPEGFISIKASSNDVMKMVEQAIGAGRWILLENVSTSLDPALEPVLLRQFSEERGGRGKMINLGEKKVAYDDKFMMYMACTNPNPHYSPETCAKVTIINFGITPKGLEEQMLATIVILENKKLEDKKNQIVSMNARNRADLEKLEDGILNSLSENQDKILNEDTIIDQLANSKRKSDEIQQSVKESKITEKLIDEAREGYRKLAFRTSVLFFCIIDLSGIDPMYQYSLQWFETLFKLGVENAPQSNSFDIRLENLTIYFTELLYRNVCRSLFGRHKLLFSFLMTTRIMQGDNKLDTEGYRYLLTGPTKEYELPANPTNGWVAETSWPELYKQICGLSELPTFRGLKEHFISSPDDWRHIYDGEKPYQDSYPGVWNKINMFDKILLTKTFRSDKVRDAIQQFVEHEKGRYFIEIPIVKLTECFEDSSSTIPLIFILSQGSDPKAEFDAFAEGMNMTNNIASISLGQGQGVRARKMIENATTTGGWVLLQNCHLAASWMSELEAIVENLSETVHKDFRLWLTSMPSSTFPIAILQNSVKMTIEPPQGLKDNLLKSYESMIDKDLEAEDKQREFKKLLYGLCFFHAVINERRKFGPIGWNKPYEFTFEDLEVCRRQLKVFLGMYEEIDYTVIKVICADINYGGRVTDKLDKRLISTIISSYICSEMLKDTYNMAEALPGDDTYLSPVAGTRSDYIQFIHSLPLNASPEVFGLHPNAAITTAQNENRDTLEILINIQPRSAGSAGSTREQIITESSKQIESKTPEVFDIEAVKKRYSPEDYNESMNTVLVQELIRYNGLLKLMKQRMIDVQRAVRGEVVMSEDLEKVANSIFNLQVPDEWQYPTGFLSLKPLNSWIEELNRRVDFFTNWINNGQPCAFWFSGFFFPQAFITGTFQNYARKNKISIDLLRFRYKPVSEIDGATCKARPDIGVYVYGIFLEGARWDERMKALNSSRPKELFSDLPTIHLIPYTDDGYTSLNVYECPLYKTVNRFGTLMTTGHSTNFVMDIELPNNEPEQDVWVRAGVAAFLSLRY